MEDKTFFLFILWMIIVILVATRSPRSGLSKMFSSLEVQPEQDSKQLLALAEGFNALLEAAKQLTRQEQLLRSRLESAHDEYLKLSSQLAEASTGQQTEASAGIPPHDITSHSNEKAAVDTAKLRKSHARVMKKETDIEMHPAEGKTACPFFLVCSWFLRDTPAMRLGSGQVVVNGESERCGNDDLDPIKAELHPGVPPCAASSTRSVTARCPIRYLNAHSPEEIAEFFQKHKHEIPRSHSICIQRYQNDPQNLRRLDGKYGDIVSMVQGLGAYHQPYLPSSPPPDMEQNGETDATDRVEKWAEDVSSKSPSPGTPPFNAVADDDGDFEARGNHFERSLRDVRVGESPSRPWGIHVPISQEPAQSDVASLPAPVPASSWSNAKKSAERPQPTPTPLVDAMGSPSRNSRCPFSHSAKQEATSNPMQPGQPLNEPRPDITQASDAAAPPPRPQSPQPRIVFNGPIIFGYSGESVALFLEKLGQFGKL
ncbi:hypothetical protein CIHG_05571 [Coccidioides immitis H538.4]|uniref:Uncharacterized protein n=1 Tax=Coccidioides immitis H538.4 TaxID=396776 RepID=A0A0J8RSR6_COCIT|nr:hypothetical protein CIHG_05571 [Coccidioides immitis H538.4]